MSQRQQDPGASAAQEIWFSVMGGTGVTRRPTTAPTQLGGITSSAAVLKVMR
jgi:hypothetical protein